MLLTDTSLHNVKPQKRIRQHKILIHHLKSQKQMPLAFRIGGKGKIIINYGNSICKTFKINPDECTIPAFHYSENGIYQIEISGDLHLIDWMDFDHCNLIHFSLLGHYPKLKALSLYNNKLNYICTELLLPQLEYLELSNNFLHRKRINQFIQKTYQNWLNGIGYSSCKNQFKFIKKDCC